MNESQLVQYDEGALVANEVLQVLFIVAATLIAILGGFVALVCIWRGGNMNWSVKFWVWVKVSCRFN